MHRSSHEPQDALHARLNPDQMAQRPLESPQLPSPSLRELSNMQNAYSSQYGMNRNSLSQYGGATPGVIANVNVTSQNERSDSAQQIQSLLNAQQPGVLDSQHLLKQDLAQQTPGISNSQGVQASAQGLSHQSTGPGGSHLAQSSSQQQHRQGQAGLQIPASSQRHGQLRWSQSGESGQQNTRNAEMFACPSEWDPCYRYPSSSLPLAIKPESSEYDTEEGKALWSCIYLMQSLNSSADWQLFFIFLQNYHLTRNVSLECKSPVSQAVMRSLLQRLLFWEILNHTCTTRLVLPWPWGLWCAFIFILLLVLCGGACFCFILANTLYQPVIMYRAVGSHVLCTISYITVQYSGTA